MEKESILDYIKKALEGKSLKQIIKDIAKENFRSYMDKNLEGNPYKDLISGKNRNLVA